MRTGLTKKQKTTVIYFDEHSRIIEVQTHNTDLKKRLTAFAAAMADPEKYIHDNKEMLKQYRTVAESEEYKASPAYRLQEYLKQFQKESGYNDVFISAMQRLSPAYREYHKSLQAANEVFLRHFQQE